jgi:uncharacterized membrane protein
MSRSGWASIIGVAGFVAYVAGVVWLGDLVIPLHWTVGVLYFTAAGLLWTWPAVLLMRWALRPG